LTAPTERRGRAISFDISGCGPAWSRPEIRRVYPKRRTGESSRAFAEERIEGESVSAVVLEVDGRDVLQAAGPQCASKHGAAMAEQAAGISKQVGSDTVDDLLAAINFLF
jgi:hypothetical protein